MDAYKQIMDSIPWRTVAVAGVTLVAGITAIAVSRAITYGYKALQLAEVPRDDLHDTFQKRKDEIAQRLAAAIRCKTVSYDRPNMPRAAKGCAFHTHGEGDGHCSTLQGAELDAALKAYRGRDDVQASYGALLQLHQLLAKEYPTMHSKLKRQVINKYSLVYVWEGADPTLQGVALYAHMDVVPANDAALWTHDPFAGTIADGFVWGRGAIDDKQSVIGICEAIEHLLVAGFKPRRNIVVIFGHDEEIGGDEGAQYAALWVEQNVKLRDAKGAIDTSRKPLAFLLDEGLFVLRDAVPGIKNRTALICTAEKGYCDAELTVELQGGHASSPPTETAIGILSKAVHKLETNQFPTHLVDAGPVPSMFETLTPYFSFPFRLIFANLWLTRPLVEWIFSLNPRTAILIRTTTAPTIFNAGFKANTLPPTARAVINHRIHPSESVASVIERDHRVISDARVKINVLNPVEPSPVADHHAPAFKVIAGSVQDLYVDTVATPALMVGATDSHWSEDIAVNLYRHCPTEMHVSETPMFHGRNERISVENIARIAAFYTAVIMRADAETL